MLKRFRYLLYAVGTLAALLTVGVGVLSTPWFQRILERRIVAGLENFTGGRVEVGEFRFRPLIFQVVFHGLVIQGLEPAGEPPLFSARTVVAGFSLSHFLHRQIRLRSLDWEYAEVHLRANPDGSTNLPDRVARLHASQMLHQAVDLSIGRLTLAHSSFSWNDQRLPLDLSARDVAILFRFSPRQRYVGTLTSSLTRLQSSRWSLPPITFTSRFEFSQTHLAVTSLAWQGPGTKGQGSLTLQTVPTPEAYFSFQGGVEIPLLAKTLRWPALRGGSLRLEGQGIYRDGDLSVRGRAQAQQAMVMAAQFNSGHFEASADYSINSKRIELSNLTLAGLGGRAQAKAEILLEGPTPRFHFETQARGVNLAALLEAASPKPILISHLHPASRIDGIVSATWQGSLEDLKSQFNLEFSPPPTIPKGALPVSGRVNGTLQIIRGVGVELSEASFQSSQSSFRAHGALAGPDFPALRANKLAMEWETTNLEEWRPLVEMLRGTAEPLPLTLESPAGFSGEISGPIGQPQIEGRLEVGEFTYRGWVWDKLVANVVAGPNLVHISSGRLERGTSSLSMDVSVEPAHWKLGRDSALHVALRAQSTPLEGLKTALGIDYPVTGNLTGRLDLHGTASKLTGTGAVRLASGQIAREPFDSLRANIRVAESAWNLEGIQLAKGRGRITGQVSFDPTSRSFSGRLQGVDFSLAEIKHLAWLAPASAPPHALDGRASFALSGEGSPEDFQLHSAWTFENIRIQDSPIGSLGIRLETQGQRIRVQGDGSGPGGTLHLSGELQLDKDWPLELEGQYAQARMEPWIRWLCNHNFSADITAGGSFKLQGPLRDPAKLELQSQAQTLEVSFPSLQLTNDQPVDLRYASHVLTASRFRMRGPSTDLEIEGSMRLAEPGALSINAQGLAEATLLSLLDSAVKATGRSELKVRVTGTPAQPLLKGTLDVRDVSLSYGDLPFQFSGLEGTIQLGGERATIGSLHGMSGGGAVTLSGFVTLAEPLRFNLQADLDQVRVRYPTNFTSVLSGNVRLGGTPDRGQLQGELTLRQIIPNENANWLVRMLATGGGSFVEQPIGAASPTASKIRLDIRVTSVPPVRLATRDLQLVSDVDVRLQGTLANPVQVGTIHLLTGEGVFRSNRYRLIRGDISLTNPLRTQPILDLEAQTRVQTYDLTVDISGPFDRLKSAFRSDPPLPTADILSLLALGYSKQQVEASTAAGNPLSSVGASALVSEALSSEVTGRIEQLFGVSRIKVDPNVGEPGYGSGARVTVEQQVTREFTLTYVTNTAASQYRIIQFEWAVSDKVSLIGVRDQNGIFGLEFRFRQRFK